MLMQNSELVHTNATRSAEQIRSWIIGEVAKSLSVEPSSIDPAAPLHSHGVDSLAAIGISAELSQWLGRDVPATLMWDYDTIDALAEAMADGQQASPASALPPGIVALQPQGSRRPLFCFPGLGGRAQNFAPLASCLDHSQPCYGVNIPEADEEGRPLRGIEDIAAVQVKRIRMVQPDGPFQLVGYSMGGMIAYQVAQELKAAGQSVSLLAFFDSFAPGGFALRPRWQRMILHAWLLTLQPGRRRYFEELRRNRRARLKAMQSDALAGNEAVENDFIARCKRAADEYLPRPYDGSAILFRATQRPDYGRFFKVDPTNGWGTLARGGVRVIDLAGGHLTLIDAAHAPDAAAALMRQLAEPATIN